SVVSIDVVGVLADDRPDDVDRCYSVRARHFADLGPETPVVPKELIDLSVLCFVGGARSFGPAGRKSRYRRLLDIAVARRHKFSSTDRGDDASGQKQPEYDAAKQRHRPNPQLVNGWAAT